MKKKILTILLLVCVLLTCVQSVGADNDWYTYTYNFWGDEVASPDAYSVANVLYGRNLGEEVGTLNDPEGMFVIDDLVYIVDTKSNRILECQYEEGQLQCTRDIQSVKVSVNKKDEMVTNVLVGTENVQKVNLTFKNPSDVFVVKTTPEKRAIYGEYLGEEYIPEPDEVTTPTDADTTDDGEDADAGDETSATSDGDELPLGAAPDGDEEPDGETPDGETPDGETPDGEDGATEKKAETKVYKDLDREYDIFIADTENNRIIHCDFDLNVIGVVKDPEDETLAKDFLFLPKKFVVDDACRYYVQALNNNAGLMEFSADGKFSCYIGASPVSMSLWTRIWRKLYTRAQLEKVIQYVPTEYNNVSIDEDGFIYVTTSTLTDKEINTGEGKPIRKLNSMGEDILIRNGNSFPIGDLHTGKIGQGDMDGASAFVDVVSFSNETYACLDKTRGKVFVYDFQGNLLYAFGNAGTTAGCFKYPSAIGVINDETILVLDRSTCTITLFELSRYGELVNEAIGLYRKGLYDESADVWREVLKYNGNYELAYVGVGRSLLRQGKYKEAMDKFEVVRDSTNYSKAFKYYREQVVEDNIAWFLVVLLALIFIPKIVRWVIRTRKEIQEA